jgi:Lon protease-like protein
VALVATHEPPTRFPIFPLPNVVLFPDTRLPLHIFEPRYRQMTADALAGDGYIGMVLLRDAASVAEPAPPVFQVGGLGRIDESSRLDDGRYELLLTAVRRFRILEEEKSDKLYRIARTELLPDPEFDELSPADRSALEETRGTLEENLYELAEKTAPRAVEGLRKRLRELDAVQLVHALAYGLDCGFVEKQGLLEAPDPVTRARLLVQILAFRRAESELPYAPKGVN